MPTADAPPAVQEVDFLICPRWLVPMRERGEILAGHGLAIKDGQIIAIGDRAMLEQSFAPAGRFDLDQHLLIPGLINAHCHSPMTLLRGYADDMPLKAWLEEKIWPVESRWVSEEFVRDGAALAIAEMSRSGATCFSDMYFFPDEVARIALQANVRAQLAAPVLDFPTAWAQTADEYILKATDLHDQYKDDSHVRVAFGPHAPYSVSDEPLKKISTLANELEIPIHIHLHENAQEVEEAVRTTGGRPLQRLHDLGLLSPLLQCVHATQLQDREIDLLAQAGATVVHCPASNMNLASGFCPVHSLLAAGVNVCLGTDGAASNNELNMINEMRLAALQGKNYSGDAGTPAAWDVLAMATINGAKAMDMDDEIGSLEAGKRADCVAINLDHCNSQPVYDPVSSLAYSVQAHQVSHVWVEGKLNLEHGKLLSLDPESLKGKAHQWAHKIRHD